MTAWFIVAGGVLVLMALSASLLRRLPLSAAMLYLAIGVGLGPAGLRLIDLDLLRDSRFIEHLAEIAVLVSLFTAGLKLRLPLHDPKWRVPVLLAFVSMTLTVGAIAALGVYGLGLSLGAAVLLGGILAPTDPVLASDVQVAHAADGDRLRFGLTAEAGLNDGTAFPFVMLGLGLLGLHDLGDSGWRWWTIDVAWAVLAGLLIGWLLGLFTGRFVLYLRQQHQEAVGLDDFIALGLTALAYGLALYVHAYGFLAVFAAGLAMRKVERQSSGEAPPAEVLAAAKQGSKDEIATSPETAPAYLAEAVLGFNEQIERIGEVAIVVLLGALLTLEMWTLDALWFVPLLLGAIRPLSVLIGLAGTRTSRLQRGLMAWFGIRGIGSIYYLSYAVTHELPAPAAERLTGLVLATVASSIVLHGVSVTPLMALYARRQKQKSGRRQPSKGDSP